MCHSVLRWSLVILVDFAVLAQAYKIGVGIADCTGPSGEVVFMGYAKSKQKGCGIHLRQFSRAFIFQQNGATPTNKMAAFVSVDSAMMAYGIKREVLHRLDLHYKNPPEPAFTDSNLILSGTHTHSTPGGFLMHLMLDIPSFGFVRDSFEALVRGIVKSIIEAHDNMVEARIFLSSGELVDGNINRSPSAYLANPEEERARFEFDTDKEMTQLKFVGVEKGDVIGVINWYAVHPTSMNNSNCLVSSDNVGYASAMLERTVNGKDTLLGRGPFVAAFASTNLGDVSPNLKGPKCTETGEDCDTLTSTCPPVPNKDNHCIASGPGKDMFDSTRIIAERLFRKATELMTDDGHEVTGPVDFVHQFVDMSTQTTNIKLENGTEIRVNGCAPAMGYSFAAGTTDGPGEFNFSQGTLSPNPFWNTIRDFIFPPTAQDVSCHHPKPILLNTGRISVPYDWQPKIVSCQIVRVGDVYIAAVPGEFTTMAGRRLRAAILKSAVGDKATPIIAGLSNVYSSYITTFEEYQMQRYEGASTIYGPHTLTLYLDIYKKLTEAVNKGDKVEPGPVPPDLMSKQITLAPGVIFDTAGFGYNFGDCLREPPDVVRKGTKVTVTFVAAHPRNHFLDHPTFLTVERLTGDSNWTVIANDANWETRFKWKRTYRSLASSNAIIQWDVPLDTPSGTYRIRHFGSHKYIFGGGIHRYEGHSKSFTVADQ